MQAESLESYGREREMMQTPYYLIDESKLARNMEIVRRVRALCGAKSLLALKCFAAWSVFPLMRRYMDGTTSSSLYEARLGREKFGKEVHAYSVAFSAREARAAAKIADKIIFNSVSQLRALGRFARGLQTGLRVNPGISYSHYDLADPARKNSRLGVVDKAELMAAAPEVSGAMFHFNCENGDFGQLSTALDLIGEKYGDFLERMDWVSLGGGIAFTRPDYPLADFCARLKRFSREFRVQVYLEPGDAAVTGVAELVTTVLDVVRNGADIAVVDASTEAHMLDHLVYRTCARISSPAPGSHDCIVAGRSCLAGDVFGRYRLGRKLKPGDIVRFADAAAYTMVKKNWFNGLPMPSICVRKMNGRLERVRSFGYGGFARSLS